MSLNRQLDEMYCESVYQYQTNYPKLQNLFLKTNYMRRDGKQNNNLI